MKSVRARCGCRDSPLPRFDRTKSVKGSMSVDFDGPAVGIGDLVMPLVEGWACGASFDGNPEPEAADLATWTGRVELEDGAICDDGGIVGGSTPVLLGGEGKAKASIEVAALLQLGRVQHQQGHPGFA
jgi:hypothetical protein